MRCPRYVRKASRNSSLIVRFSALAAASDLLRHIGRKRNGELPAGALHHQYHYEVMDSNATCGSGLSGALLNHPVPGVDLRTLNPAHDEGRAIRR